MGLMTEQSLDSQVTDCDDIQPLVRCAFIQF